MTFVGIHPYNIIFTVYEGTYDLGAVLTPRRYPFTCNKWHNVQQTIPSKNDSIRDVIEDAVLINEGLVS
jgi:hypothetical protein